MNAQDVESCIFPPSRSMRMPTLRTNTRCYLVERAWVTDTDRWLFGNSETATRGNSSGSTLDRFNASMSEDDIRELLHDCTIAVPGKLTSAFLALQLFLGEFDFTVVPFDRIFDAVQTGRADAGLIIH